MQLTDYLGIPIFQIQEYIDNGFVDANFHDDFPLGILTYGRKTVHEDAWDNVTKKCRGLIFNTETLEIVARPFEKFFNYGALQAGEIPSTPPDQIVEKLDGFLCTLYQYNGKSYVASKGSFHSVHAKWATAWYDEHCKNAVWPEGYTPVFEGITPNIRIVVDYGAEEGLFLTAVINNETGAELPRERVVSLAYANGVQAPINYKDDWQTLVANSFKDTTKNFEGYVFVWNSFCPPFRLKVKYVEYLRLHRMISSTTPKRILEALAGNSWSGEMNALLTEGPPWFNQFVKKWKIILEKEFNDCAFRAVKLFEDVRKKLLVPPFGNAFPTRKDWAVEFNQEKNKRYAPILFAMLDGKELSQINQIIWKLVKPVIKNGKPLLDTTKL